MALWEGSLPLSVASSPGPYLVAVDRASLWTAEHLDIHYSLNPGVQEICISLALQKFFQLVRYVSSTLPLNAWSFTNGIYTIRRPHGWISFQYASWAHSCWEAEDQQKELGEERRNLFAWKSFAVSDSKELISLDW